MKDSNIRYAVAQEAEIKSWNNSNKKFDKHLAVQEFSNLGIVIPLVTGKVLDVGGAYGHYASLFCSASERIVVDPLYEKYGIRLNGIVGIASQGECLPFASDSFDFIILRNIIDHMLKPKILLEEIYRVLKPEGNVCFMVNTFVPAIKPLFPILNIIDKPHPLHFTVHDARKLLTETRFHILRERQALSCRLELRLKRILGIIIKREYYAVLSKTNSCH